MTVNGIIQWWRYLGAYLWNYGTWNMEFTFNYNRSIVGALSICMTMNWLPVCLFIYSERCVECVCVLVDVESVITCIVYRHCFKSIVSLFLFTYTGHYANVLQPATQLSGIKCVLSVCHFSRVFELKLQKCIACTCTCVCFLWIVK